MPTIELITEIRSTIDICFDLARSIDLHKISTANTHEEAIDGKTSGLIELNEFVTWRAKHLGFTQTLSSKITAFDKPHYFVDEQLKGPFKSIHHIHKFEQLEGNVIMTDTFEFQAPFGLLGHIFNRLVLTNHLTQLLVERNQVIKEFAETDKWKIVLRENFTN